MNWIRTEKLYYGLIFVLIVIFQICKVLLKIDVGALCINSVID